ncbi:MAG: TonB-dependent receptor [Melioribacteraceae bacterium]|nr:TonB-dependent receptor [Melioribacteraceae bacterium]
MNRLSFYFAVIVLININFLTNINAEEKILEYGEITGKVIDVSTGESLPGVNLIIEHTTVGAASNIDGSFKIGKVPTGKITVTASLVGYRTESFDITLNADQIVELNFELREGIFEMGSVVITGTGTPHLYEDMPVKTEIIPQKVIQQTQSVNLACALNFQTGVRVENDCQNCNFTQVKILGFDGKYTQILIDGDPVISSLGGVYGLEHFPNEMIEQLEIVKGGGSALYGGGAVAGTINMITRRPAFNKAQFSYTGHSLDGQMDHKIGGFAEIVSNNGKSGAYIFGSTRKRNSYDHNGDGFSELGTLSNATFGINWYYRALENSELAISFHKIHEDRRGGNDFNLPVHEADVSEWLDHVRWGGKIRWEQRLSALLDYKVYYAFSLIERKSYFGGLGGNTPEDKLEALNFYGKTNNPMYVTGMQTNYRLENQLITAGIQYSEDKLEDNTVSNEVYHIDHNFTNFGAFIQDNFHFGEHNDLEIIIGARIDKHSELNSTIISPRINIKYAFHNGIKLRAGYTTGFKAPQIYNEDLHIGGLSGDQKTIKNSKSLKEERSKSYNMGFEYQEFVGDVALLIGFTGFYTKLDDAFATRYLRSEGNLDVWERYNSNSATVMGGELDLGIKPTNDLEIRGGIVLMDNEYEEADPDFNTKKFLRTPNSFGYLRASYEAAKSLNFFLGARFTGDAEVPHEITVEGSEDPLLILEQSNGYLEFDLGMAYKIPFLQNLDTILSLGIKNITNEYQDNLDTGAERDPAYVYGPSLPRSIYFGLSTSF